MRKKLLLSLACTIIAATNVHAQQSERKLLSTNNVVELKQSVLRTSVSENIKSFEVDVQEAGSYSVSFWLIPAKLANGSYTTYKVYVNDVFSTTIQPTKGNWQSLTTQKPLSLKSGINKISISTANPQIPEVESVKVSKNVRTSKFVSDNYDAYLEKAKHSNTLVDDNLFEGGSMRTSAVGITVRQNIPLKYSFYTKFNFSEGQVLFITSNSGVEHGIDVFYIDKTLPRIIAIEDEIEGPLPTLPKEPTFPTIPRNPDVTPLIPIYWQTDYIQKINWHAPSFPTANNPNIHVATAHVTIPRTGTYMIKLRSKENRVLSTASLNIDGRYFYQDVPMYYSFVECKMPADENSYGSLTMCRTDEDDPLLFVESGWGKRVVGYNDDAPEAKRAFFDLKQKDSYVRKKYLVETAGIHVGNYSSSNPESTCIIMGALSDDAELAMAPSRNSAPAKVVTNINETVADNAPSISPQSLRLGESLNVSSLNRISALRVYNMSGNEIAERKIDSNNTVVSISDLNIQSSGVYIVVVETANGIVKKQKIFVR